MQGYKKLALVVVCCAVLGCTSKEESLNKYLASAKDHFEQGDMAVARIQLKNVLQIDPSNAEATFWLGLVAEEEKNWADLYRQMLRTVEIQPDHYEAKLKIAQIQILAKRYEEAKITANELTQIAPESAEAYALQGSIAAASQDFKLAGEYLDKAEKAGLAAYQVLTQRALIERAVGNLGAAESLLDQAIAVAENTLPIRLVKIDLYESSSNTTALGKELALLASQYPDNRIFPLKMARLSVSSGDFAGAEQVLANYLRQNPDDLAIQTSYLDVIRKQSPERAERVLDEFIEKNPVSIPLRELKVSQLVADGRGSEAQSQVDWIIGNTNDPLAARRAKSLKARFLYGKGSREKALGLIREVLEEDKYDESALLARASFFLGEGKIESAISDLRIVLRNNASSEEGLLLLGQAYLANGSSQLADDTFRELLDINPVNMQAVLPVAESLIREKQYSRSEQMLRGALERYPENPVLLSMLAQVEMLKKDWAASLGAVEQMVSTGGKSAYSEFLGGRIYQGQAQHARAIDKFKASLSIDPAFIRSLEGLAYSYVRLSQADQLETFLEGYQRQHPKVMPVYGMLSKLAAQSGEPAAERAYVEKGLSVDDTWESGYIALASIVGRSEGIEKAVETYREGLQKVPESQKLLMILAMAYESIGKYSEASVLYENALELSPNNQIAINNLANLLLDKLEGAENTSRALELASKFENSRQPYFVDTYAWALAKSGDYAKSESLLESLVSENLESPIFYYHYISVLILADKAEKSRLAIEKYKALFSSTEAGIEMLAQLENNLSKIQ